MKSQWRKPPVPKKSPRCLVETQDLQSKHAQDQFSIITLISLWLPKELIKNVGFQIHCLKKNEECKSMKSQWRKPPVRKNLLGI
jgi:hypothetical protein